MTTVDSTTMIGIHCHVVWLDEDPKYFYISFGDYDYDTEPTHDSFGVLDEDIFYYFSNNEVKCLLETITQGASDTYQVANEWYIDIPMGYELVTS